MTETFRGEVRVASRIVDYLSSGLYNSPAACLKELVNNSFDADARLVEIFMKPDANQIIVADDGLGMSRVEFVEHFERISESHKRDSADLTPSGRPKIGKIGIGFIAANELCDVMEIASTMQGSTELLRVEVNFREMRTDTADRRRDGDTFVKGDYEGSVEETTQEEHYTHIFLKDVRENVRGILSGILHRPHVGGTRSIYGLNVESVTRLLESASDWGDLDEYSQAMLQVALNVPVRFLPGWRAGIDAESVDSLERQVADLRFQVVADGGELRKPVVLQHDGEYVLHPVSIQGSHVSASGYLYARHGVLRPQWLNGSLIRIRNAAVGEYDRSFLNFKTSESTLFQRWTTCEIWADDRLEEALNIDRRTLRITHPAFVELQEGLHAAMSDFFKDVRRQLYSDRATRRRVNEAREIADRFADVIEDKALGLPAKMRRDLVAETQRWVAPERVESPADLRGVVRQYSAADVFDLVLEVARDTLPREQYQRFAAALAERLLR